MFSSVDSLICDDDLSQVCPASLQRQTSMTKMERWLTGWMDGQYNPNWQHLMMFKTDSSSYDIKTNFRFTASLNGC